MWEKSREENKQQKMIIGDSNIGILEYWSNEAQTLTVINIFKILKTRQRISKQNQKYKKGSNRTKNLKIQ